MEKTGLEIVNEKAAKIVAFFDIPKPQKKRMFLTGIALGFLVLSWCIADVDAAASIPSGVTSGGSNGYCFVTTSGKIYRNGAFAFTEETGFSKCAIAPTFGACGIKSDGSAKCENGFTASSVALMEGIDTGSFYSDSPLMAVVGTAGDYKVVNPSGTVQFSVPSGTTFGRTSGIGGAWPCYVTDGTAYYYRGGVEYIVTGAVSCTVGGVDGNLWYVALKTDGTLQANAGYVPSGNYDEMSGRHHGFTCVRDAATQKPVCFDYYGLQSANLPDFPVRDIVVYGDYNSPYGAKFACAVRQSDNVFGCWNSGQAFTAVTTTPAAGGPVEPPVITYPDGTECYNFTVPKLSSVAWMTPEFMFSTGTVTTQVFTGGSNYGCTGWGQKCGDKIRTLNDDGSGNMDFLTIYNYDSSSVVRTPSWRNPATATGPRSTLIADDFEPQILGIGSIRDNVKYAADVWQFASVQNPGINVPWAYWISEGKGVNQVFASGGTATLVNANMTTSLTLFLQEFSVPPIGFRMGKSTESEAKTQCRIGNNACTWELRGTQYQCMPKIYNGYAGVCSVDTNGRCSPTITASGTVSEPLPIEGSNVTTDQYGNVISVTPGTSNVEGTKVNLSGVFDCSEYDGFLDIFPCSLQVAKNVWQLVSDSVNQTDSAARSVTDTMSSVSSGSTGSINLSPVTNSGANLAENMFIGAWNNTWEMNEFNKWGYFALIGSLFLMVLAVVFVIALINRK